MSVSYTMGSTKPLLFVILLSIYSIQNIQCQCKDLGDVITPANDLLNKPYPLATRDRDLRGVLEQIKSAADQIKNRALASWNYLKRVAERTRGDILKWVNSARQYAIELEKSVENQLQAMRRRLGEMVTGIVGDLEQMRQCLIDDAKIIDDRLTAISYDLAQCLSDEISKLRPIKGKQGNLVVNDTLFIADLDRKLDACKADKANYEECLNTVGDLVNEDIEEKHNELQNTGMEMRSLADNIRESMLSCAERNTREAVSFLAREAMEIVNCALKRRDQ